MRMRTIINRLLTALQGPAELREDGAGRLQASPALDGARQWRSFS